MFQFKHRLYAAWVAICVVLAANAQDGRWSYGLQAGVTAHTTTGSLHDNFKGCVGFTGGLTAVYRQLRLKADVAYGQPSFSNSNMYAVYDERGRDAQLNAVANATHIGTSLQVGCTVLDAGRVAVTPCAGLYHSHYSWRLNDIEWDVDEQGMDYFQVTDTHRTTQSRLTWIASVDIDIRLHDSYTTLLGDQRRLRQSLRVTPWVTSVKHKSVVPSVSGLQLGVSVTYSGLIATIIGN